MKTAWTFIALYLAFWARKVHPTEHQTLAEGGHDALPADGHLSPGPLPQELLDDVECICDSHKQSCHHNGKNASCHDARIFYFIGIHNNRTLEAALYLLRGIRDPRNTILFHIDTKFAFHNYERSTLRQEVEACPCGSQIEVVSRYNATWGSWSMVEPTLWAMQKAVEDYGDKWDVFINLSGDTLPVYKPDRLASLFGGPLRGINFITSSACETGLLATPISAFPEKWHKRRHYSQHHMTLNYTDDDGVDHSNVSLPIYFGSQWMTLQPDWCKYLVEQMKRPFSLACQFRDYLIATKKLMTDETFVPSLLMYLQPESTPKVGPNYQLLISNEDSGNSSQEPLKIFAIRYERMDEHVPSSNGWYPKEQRYEVPASSNVDVPKPWGPYYLGVYDLANIRQYGALFIRKVATEIDPNLFSLLPVDAPGDIPLIGWPKEVKITPLPDWEKKLAIMKEKYLLEREQHEQNDISKHGGGDQMSSVDDSETEKKVTLSGEDDEHGSASSGDHGDKASPLLSGRDKYEEKELL